MYIHVYLLAVLLCLAFAGTMLPPVDQRQGGRAGPCIISLLTLAYVSKNKEGTQSLNLQCRPLSPPSGRRVITQTHTVNICYCSPLLNQGCFSLFLLVDV